MNRRGFTLLEVLVATFIMAIAVVGVLAGIGSSMRSAARLTSYDRGVMLARSKMDELLVDRRIPFGATLEGRFEMADAGWSARFSPMITQQGAPPGSPVLERVELEVWWVTGGERHTFPLEGYRRSRIPVPSL